MKAFALFLAVLVATTSCTSNKTEEAAVENPAADSTQLIVGDIASEKYLTELLGNSGMIRGFNFGDPFDKILKEESLELFEERPGHVGFMLERDNLESADFLYLRDADNKLNGVDIDIYLNSPEVSDALFRTAKSHYSARYKSSPTDSLTWLIPPKGYVKISQVKKALDNGMEINYRKQ